MQRAEQLHIAKLSCIIGGALLLAGAAITGLALFAFALGAAAFLGGEFVAFTGIFAIFALFVVAVGSLTGAIVLMGAFRLDGPHGKQWALASLIAGIIGAVTGGGFFVGAVAAIVGGGLAYALPES